MNRVSKRMKLLSLCLCVVLAIHSSVEVKITSDGLRRVIHGENFTFRWTVDEVISNFNIYNMSTGLVTPLNPFSYHNYDKISGVITLVLIDVQLWDAGNYSLQIIKGSTTTSDSTACLFVYERIEVDVIRAFGSDSATEGDSLEFTCNCTSVSLPATYRSIMYYSWEISKYGRFQNISSGPAMRSNGEIVPGYNIKNNGRTLVISSVRYPDDQYVYCGCVEEGSNLQWSRRRYFYFFFDDFDDHCISDILEQCDSFQIKWSIDVYLLSMRHRPRIYNLNPESKKFNVALGKPVEFYFRTEAKPSILSNTGWTFVNSAGILQKLPLDLTTTYNDGHSFRLNMTSTAYYGNYSIGFTNAIGSTTLTLQVLPEGPPDAPSYLRLYYASHREIAIQWNLMWSNSFTRFQTVHLSLRLSESIANDQTSDVIHLSDSYNSTQTHRFTKNIQPGMNYKVSVWSVNGFGSSEVVELEVRTRRQPKLIVSPETISIKGTQAIIDFTVEMNDDDAEPIAKVEAQCCSVLSGQCSKYSGRYASNQVVVEDIPNDTVYYIDLTAYSGIYNKYIYYSAAVRDVRVPRSRNEAPTNESLLIQANDGNVAEDKSTLPIVIILGVLLGITSLALIGVLIIIVKTNFRRNRQSHKPKQISREERPQSLENHTYEAMAMDSSEDHCYASVMVGPAVRGSRF